MKEEVGKSVDIVRAEEKLREYHVQQLQKWACEKEAEARALFEAAKRLESEGRVY